MLYCHEQLEDKAHIFSSIRLVWWQLNQEEIYVINIYTGSTKRQLNPALSLCSVGLAYFLSQRKQIIIISLYTTERSIQMFQKRENMENTVSVNSNIPHFHTEGLTKKHVHDVDEVHKEDFSPAGCLCAWLTDRRRSGLCL